MLLAHYINNKSNKTKKKDRTSMTRLNCKNIAGILLVAPTLLTAEVKLDIETILV